MEGNVCELLHILDNKVEDRFANYQVSVKYTLRECTPLLFLICAVLQGVRWGRPAPLGANLTKGLKCCLMNSASDMIAKYTVQIFASIARHHVKHP